MNRFNLTPAVKIILYINIGFFLLSLLLWFSFTTSTGENFDLHNYLALFYYKSEKFKIYQFITHMFMHAYINQYGRIALYHIFFNMFALVMFGKVVESVLGTKKFVFFYFSAGLGAALLHMLAIHFQISAVITQVNEFLNYPTYELFNQIVNKNISNPSSELIAFMDKFFYDAENTQLISTAKQYASIIVNYKLNDTAMVGASGAIFGVLIGFAMLFPNAELMLLFFPVPIKAKYLIPGMAVLELIMGVANFQWDNFAHYAHLGGALVGFIMIKMWKKNQFMVY